MALHDTFALLKRDPEGSHTFYPPQEGSAVQALEQRLGRQLPKSFVRFLALTDGVLLFGQERILGVGGAVEHTLEGWVNQLKEAGAPAYLLPFAPTDDGVDCFDTRGRLVEGEWPVTFFAGGRESDAATHEAFDEWLFELAESLRDGLSMPEASHVRDEADDGS